MSVQNILPGFVFSKCRRGNRPEYGMPCADRENFDNIGFIKNGTATFKYNNLILFKNNSKVYFDLVSLCI